MDIAEGDIFKDIQEVWVAEISRAILRAIAEAKAGKVEEGNQQFKDEWTKCSKMQW